MSVFMIVSVLLCLLGVYIFSINKRKISGPSPQFTDELRMVFISPDDEHIACINATRKEIKQAVTMGLAKYKKTKGKTKLACPINKTWVQILKEVRLATITITE